jgi:hypothetical protein
MGGWSSRDSKWTHGSFHVVDFIFGRTTHAKRALVGPVAVKIPLPERAYDGTVTIEVREWRRKRWPFVWHRMIGADVDCKNDPLPFPGKGENSWDCGEDATYSSSAPCPTGKVADAIGHMVAHVLDTRRRYGGEGWLPKEDHRPKSTPPGSVAPPASADTSAS